ISSFSIARSTNKLMYLLPANEDVVFISRRLAMKGSARRSSVRSMLRTSYMLLWMTSHGSAAATMRLAMTMPLVSEYGGKQYLMYSCYAMTSLMRAYGQDAYV